MATDAERRAAATAIYLKWLVDDYPNSRAIVVADLMNLMDSHFPDEPSDTADDTARLAEAVIARVCRWVNSDTHADPAVSYSQIRDEIIGFLRDARAKDPQ